MPAFTNGPIKIKHARKLIQNYKKKKWTYLDNDDNTRGVWFDKDTLLTALKSSTDVSGLRFYFAGYETQQLGKGKHPKHIVDEEKATLVMITTKTKLDNAGRKVEDPDRPGFYIELDDIPEHEKDDKPEYDDSKDVVHNDGQLCPPPPVSDLGLYNKV